MDMLTYVAYSFGGAFLSNALPHLVAGAMGEPFQSPFAKPAGQGLSSSTVNVVWGFGNLVVAYLLLLHVGSFDLRSLEDIVPGAGGFLAMSVMSARHFGKFHGGNEPLSRR